MEDDEIKRLIEAVLFVSGRNLSVEELARICESGNLGKIKRLAENLRKEYEERKGGIKIFFSENCYSMNVAEDMRNKIINLSPVKEISKGMLKILSFVAYYQPVKQKDVFEKFGYVYNTISKLEELGFIKSYREKNYKILKTTKKFEEYFEITPEEIKKRIQKQ